LLFGENGLWSDVINGFTGQVNNGKNFSYTVRMMTSVCKTHSFSEMIFMKNYTCNVHSLAKGKRNARYFFLFFT
jgi:hypothetical protein